jgi:hypothetical protein
MYWSRSCFTGSAGFVGLVLAVAAFFVLDLGFLANVAIVNLST